MSETIRMDSDTKKHLDVHVRRSKSLDVESEEWQLEEVQASVAELDAGRGVSHDKVAIWLASWGKCSETKVPR